jgi:hypothetical protein
VDVEQEYGCGLSLASTSAVGYDSFAEVPVAVGVLRATARLLDLLAEFLADADTAVRTDLGRFVVAGQSAAATPVVEAAIVVHELTEAADLLHALAGDGDTRGGPGSVT